MSRFNYELRKRLRPRYKKLPGKLCFYCGDLATCHDHVPPVSCMNEPEGFLIPACQECNAHLHTYPFRNLTDRRKYLLKKYKKKYKSLLGNRKQWTDKQLSELAKDMRKSAASIEAERRRLKRRFTLLQATLNKRGI